MAAQPSFTTLEDSPFRVRPEAYRTSALVRVPPAETEGALRREHPGYDELVGVVRALPRLVRPCHRPVDAKEIVLTGDFGPAAARAQALPFAPTKEFLLRCRLEFGLLPLLLVPGPGLDQTRVNTALRAVRLPSSAAATASPGCFLGSNDFWRRLDELEHQRAGGAEAGLGLVLRSPADAAGVVACWRSGTWPDFFDRFVRLGLEAEDVGPLYDYEGVVGFVSPKPTGGMVPLYAAYSGADHFYTTSEAEYRQCLASGWADRGVACFVHPGAATDRVPLFRLYNRAAQDHLYTVDPWERDSAAEQGWDVEGDRRPCCYLRQAVAPEHVPLHRAYDAVPRDHVYTTAFVEIDDALVERPPQELAREHPALLFPVHLETRFVGQELLVRVYPDQPVLERRELGLSEEEAAAADKVRAALADSAPGALEAACAELARRHGPERAAEIVTVARAREAGHGDSVGLPRVRVLPDRFVAFLYVWDARGERCVHRQAGRRIAAPLAVLAVPWGEATGDDVLFDDASRWVADFDRAVESGMALRVDLSRIEGVDAQNPFFSRVMAAGVRASASPLRSERLLRELVEEQKRAGELAFLPDGTPTNNTQDVRSGYAEGVGEGSKRRTAAVVDAVPDGNAALLAAALGTDLTLFAGLEHGDDTVLASARSMHEALWWALGGAYLEHLLPGAAGTPLPDVLGAHFVDFVRARGPLPALRVKRDPYGILPVTGLRSYRRAPVGSGGLTGPLHKVLLALLDRWQALAADIGRVPRVGGRKGESGYDPAAELLQVLAMQPRSIGSRVQPVVDDRLMAWLLRILAGAADEAGKAPYRAWIHDWIDNKEEGLRLLEALATAANTTPADLDKAATLRLFAWGDGYEPAAGDPALLDALLAQARNNATTRDLRVPPASRVEAVAEATRRVKEKEKFEPEVVDGLFRDALDLHTHRLDAWLSSLAHERLRYLRTSKPRGLRLGAYGWVENLRRSEEPAHTSGGFVHGPSIGQASAACVLRNAHLTHRAAGTASLSGINLSSARVREALDLVDGIRSGQQLGALLGYRFERGLHEQAAAARPTPLHGLVAGIADLRQRFPLTLSDLTELNGAETAPPGEVPRIALETVLDGDGLALAYQKLRDGQAGDQLAGWLGNLPDAAAQAAARAELERLLEALDGYRDLLHAESVFQIVGGKPERAARAFHAASGRLPPPEIESVLTPVSGTSLGHLVCLILRPDGAQPKNPGPRAEAEPLLHGLLRRLLARFGLGALDRLGIDALDLLYLCQSKASAEGASELERLAAYRARLGKAGTAGVDLSTLQPTLDFCRYVADLLGAGSTYLRPGSFGAPAAGQPPVFSRADYADLLGRVVRARTRLAGQLGGLDPVELARHGFSDAVPAGPDIDEALRKRLTEEVRARLASCDRWLADAAGRLLPETWEDPVPDQGGAIDALVQAMRALFGGGFVVLPLFAAPRAAQLARALAQTNLLPDTGEERLMLWLQQVADTHPNVRRLETMLMADEATATIAGDGLHLRLLQLPYDADRAWLGLADAELPAGQRERIAGDPAEAGRAGDVLSVVAATAEGFDFVEKKGGPSRVGGVAIDAWSELIPSRDVTTGLGLQHDGPNTQAPQALLLAVPARVDEASGAWPVDEIAEILVDTLDLAKVRAVDPDALDSVERVFPALFLPTVTGTPSWERSGSPLPGLDEFLRSGEAKASGLTTNRSVDFRMAVVGSSPGRVFTIEGFRFRALGADDPRVREVTVASAQFPGAPPAPRRMLSLPHEGLFISWRARALVEELLVVASQGQAVTAAFFDARGAVQAQARHPGDGLLRAMRPDRALSSICAVLLRGGGGQAFLQGISRDPRFVMM